jgi:hypothetical protein
METGLRVGITVVFLAALFFASFRAVAQAKAEPSAIESCSAQVEGIKLHYLTAGHGPAVILLHCYTQTSRRLRSFSQLTLSDKAH